MKFVILNALLSSIKPADPYSEAEVKARGVMNRLKDDGKVQDWELTSDPNGPDVQILWMEPGDPALKKMRLNLKKLDRNLLAVMEVLES